MKNNYKVINGVVTVEIISKGVTYEMLIDEEDFKLTSEVAGSIYQSRGYANIVDSDGTNQRLHRFILGYPEGKVIDHINGNKLDNRRINLRAVTVKENNRNLNNRTRLGKNSPRGVHYKKCRIKNPWIVNIRGKHYGCFPTSELASEVANKVYAELKEQEREIYFRDAH